MRSSDSAKASTDDLLLYFVAVQTGKALPDCLRQGL